MIYCPFCGRKLDYKLEDGITTCGNCYRVFDSSSYHKILSAAWAVRRWHNFNLAFIVQKCKLNPVEARIIDHYIIDLNLDHDQFYQALRTELAELVAK